MHTFARPIIVLLWLLCSFASASTNNFEAKFTKQAGTFLDSLTPEQTKLCLLDHDDQRRWKMQYTPGKRAGIAIGLLSPEQKALFETTIGLVLSKQGWELANKVAQQDGEQALDKYYIACFGDPRTDKSFAFRLAEHHLTIVHFSISDGETKEFGPILLGSNPATLWEEDETALIKLWKLAKDSKLLEKDKRAVASKSMNKGDGVRYTALNNQAKAQLQKAWDSRLRIFTPAVQQSINTLHKNNGGWEAARLAFYNQAPIKRCIDGGRWDFNCQLGSLLWDYQGSGGHIHMSLWVKDRK